VIGEIFRAFIYTATMSEIEVKNGLLKLLLILMRHLC